MKLIITSDSLKLAFTKTKVIAFGVSVFLITGFSAITLGQTSTITSNFNGTPIAGNRFLWFNSHVNIKNHTPHTILYFKGSNITFKVNGITYNLAVPKSQISYVSPGQLPNHKATYSFNNATQTWIIRIPQNYFGDVFLSGIAYKVPDTGFPGGINPVNWSADFSSNDADISVQWQWATAVYTNFSTDYEQLKIDVTGDSIHIGAPLNYTGYVVGGARGGGGSNYTGSWSATEGFNAEQITYSKIGRFVFKDVNHNGKKDKGDTTIPNVRVILYDALNNFVAQTVTDSTGYYLIDSIPVTKGDYYKIQFIKPNSEYFFVTPNVIGSDSTNASIADPSTGLSPLFLLNRNEQKFTINAGMVVAEALQPMPVKMGNLNISFSNSKTILKWETYSESNINKFDIERSIDGISFTSIGSIAAVGNSNITNKYQFNDRFPVKGENYYRIKIVDKDQHSSFSNVVAINITKAPATIKSFSVTDVFPNPFVDKINIAIESELNTQATIRVYDYEGRLIKKQNDTIQKGTSNLFVNNLSSISKGAYLLEVRTSSGILISKLKK